MNPEVVIATAILESARTCGIIFTIQENINNEVELIVNSKCTRSRQTMHMIKSSSSIIATILKTETASAIAEAESIMKTTRLS